MRPLASCALLLACTAARGQDLDAACARLEAEIASARASAAWRLELIVAERAGLRDEMRRTEDALAAMEKGVAWLGDRERTLLDDLAQAERAAATLRAEEAAEAALLGESRKELEAAVAALGPSRRAFDTFDAALRAGPEHGANARALLLDRYLAHFERVRGVARVYGQAVLPDGAKEPGQFLLCGALGGAFWGERGTLGIAWLPRGESEYRVIPRPLSRGERAALKDAFQGKDESALLPVEVSGGMAWARLREERTWSELLLAGGIVMLPLGLMACGLVLILLERGTHLRSRVARGEGLLADVLALTRRGEHAQASALAAAARTPLGRVLCAGVSARDFGRAHVELVLAEAVERERPGLERFTSVLGVAAVVAPLLGLAGTAGSLIEVLRTAAAYGSWQTTMFARGAADALVATVAGLVLAIPFVCARAWLVRRAAAARRRLEHAAARLADGLRGCTAGAKE